ncbi:MAG: hypothetical protein GX358_08955 [candidate division WS1 bacterium]|nr:hypothetical protein [candidate division WS1 bacterium]
MTRGTLSHLMHSTLLAVSALLLMVAATCSAQLAAEDMTMKVGVATTAITPQQSMTMGGFSARTEPSISIIRDLLAQVVVFDNGDTRVGIVAVDLLKVPVPYFEAMRDAGERNGIPRAHLLVNHSHTHCGPHVFARDNQPYMQEMTAKVCDLIEQAVANLQPVRLEYSQIPCTMGVNRRQMGPDGTPAGMRPEPRKPIDPDVPVLWAISPENQVRLVMFGYACHPTTMGGLEFSTDYVGYSRDWVEAAYPTSTAVFLQGCGGDIKPRACTAAGGFGYVLLEPKEITAQVGYELGRAVVAAMTVPGRPVSSFLAGLSDIAGLPTTKQVEDTPEGGLFPCEAQALRIGDIYMVGLNGEILVGIGLHIKRELADLTVWVNGYSNRDLSYVPDAASFDEGGYEVRVSWTTADAEEVLVSKAVELVRSLQQAR